MSEMIIPIGLDIETSTNNTLSGVIIQIGVAFYKNNEIYSEQWSVKYPISYWNNDNWSLESSQVHNISKQYLDQSSNNIEELDAILYNYLKSLNSEAIFIPVGFNVGSYDLMFIKKEMPKLHSILSHRTIELNTLFLIQSKKGDYINRNWSEKKKHTINKIIAKLGENKLHSAGFDALLALHILEEFSLSNNGKQ
jgi:oligoribonuclease (3'-5' exoribonuclease)